MKKYILSGLLLAVLTYGVVWNGLATRFEAVALARLKMAEAHGVHIAYQSEHKAGFPFSLQVILESVTVTTPQRLTLNAPIVVFGIPLRHRHQLTIAASEPALSGLTATGTVTADTVFAAILPSSTKDAPRLIVNALNVHFPQPEIAMLGNDIKRLTLDATLQGTLSDLSEKSLATWRDNGGTLEVHELSADWGPLGFGMGGTVALDENFQPVGAFTASIAGYQDLTQALTANGSLKSSHASLINAALGLMAKPAGPDNIPTIEVPITIQGQTLYLGPFKLCAMPSLALN
jgi:hypothetical protein